MFTMINRKEHARRRRIIGPIVSEGAVRRFEPTMLLHIKKCFSFLSNTEGASLHINDFIRGSSEGWSSARNMSDWFDYLSFDIMSDLIFGVKYNLLENPTKRYFFKAIDESNQRVSVFLYYPLIRSMTWLYLIIYPRAIEARDRLLSFIGQLVDDGMKSSCDSTGSNLFSMLSSAKDHTTGEGFSMKEIIAESTNLCIASVDTTSTTMSATFFYLSRHQKAYQKALREVRATFSSIDDIRIGSKLNSCTYLRACIDEALRLAPPAGSSPIREVLEGGARVAGEFFPAGTLVGVPIYSIHHNAQYFPEAFAFKPERWIGSENAEAVKLAQSAFCPFSVGPRSCIGKTVAMTELMLTMAVALFTLDFRFDGDEQGSNLVSEPKEFILQDFITARTDGPMIRFRSRKTKG
jgi:cytochrome P450